MRVLRQAAGTLARVLARQQHFFLQTSGGQPGRDAVLRPRAGRRTSRLDALRNRAVDQRSVAGRRGHYGTTVAAVVKHLLRKIVVRIAELKRLENASKREMFLGSFRLRGENSFSRLQRARDHVEQMITVAYAGKSRCKGHIGQGLERFRF